MDRSLRDTVYAGLGLSIVLGLGAGLFLLHLVHALGEGEDFRTFLYGILIPMLFSVGLVAGGCWLWRRGTNAAAVRRIAGWCLLGAVVLALGSSLIILYEQAEGVRMNDRLFVVAGQASIGGVVGFVVGLFEVRHRDARDRAELLSEQLSVLNRVLRHDIRNEANVILGRTGLLADRLDDPEQAETIERKAATLVELGDQARVVERLLRQEHERERTDVTAVVETHVERLAADHPAAEIETRIPGDVHVFAHPLIGVAVENVLDNAIEHADGAPAITVACARVTEGRTDCVEVRVADDGPGIAPEQIAVLEQGYETPLDHTSGLGLWLVNWIVEESGGDVWFEENEPSGSVVCLRLERAPAPSSA